MSTIKVDTIATRTGSGNITLSNSLASATIAGDLAVDTNVLKVDSTNNRVGIGVTSPSRKLELNNGGTGAFVTFTDGVATNFTFKTDGSNVGTFGTEAGSTHLGLMASGTERVRIHSGGVMSVSNGIELGSGLDATAANVLDDYEEGTWTPALEFGTGGTTGITYTTQSAFYTKVGRVVHIIWRIYLSNKGSSSGHAAVTGLPFAPANVPTGGVFLYISNRGNVGMSDEHAYGYLSDGSSKLLIYSGDNDGTGNSAQNQNSFYNNTELEASMTYFTNA